MVELARRICRSARGATRYLSTNGLILLLVYISCLGHCGEELKKGRYCRLFKSTSSNNGKEATLVDILDHDDPSLRLGKASVIRNSTMYTLYVERLIHSTDMQSGVSNYISQVYMIELLHKFRLTNTQVGTREPRPGTWVVSSTSPPWDHPSAGPIY